MHVGDGPEICNACGDFDNYVMPDVYFKNSQVTYQNLTDKNGRPMSFGSKGEKARYLRAHGLSEAGDMSGGSRGFNTRVSAPSMESRRAAVREAVAKAYQQIRYGGPRRAKSR